jgi:hypothetical protein
MAAQDSHRPGDDLVALAGARFPALSQAELKLLRAAPCALECGPSTDALPLCSADLQVGTSASWHCADLKVSATGRHEEARDARAAARQLTGHTPKLPATSLSALCVAYM